MDEMVIKALAKWPNVPACYGWLGLDARGQWWMRDDGAQAAGGFTSGAQGAKGSLLQHDKLIAFIGRNYSATEQGAWYFQNGPQQVFVELEATPLVWRISAQSPASKDAPAVLSVHNHANQEARVQRCITDEYGRVYLECDTGFGLVHSLDVQLAADAIESGLWVLTQIPAAQLPERFAYVRSPQKANQRADSEK
jgi:Protein of unknown function (DUF2946)